MKVDISNIYIQLCRLGFYSDGRSYPWNTKQRLYVF